MSHSFDEIIDRQSTESVKWHFYDPDVIPMWVADMDFRSPEPVIEVLQKRIAHGIFGYAEDPTELSTLIVERMQRLYGWKIQPEDVVLLPGVVVGFNLAAQAVAGAGKGVVMQTPVYHPFFGVAKNMGGIQQSMELVRQPDGSYEIDWDALEASFTEQTGMFLLCNPHNPVGRVFRKDELERLADLCLRWGVTICSDEIHCDFIYDDRKHIPVASLGKEIARNTITLMAPSKTFNIAGLECSFAIVQNPELRKKLCDARKGICPSPNFLGVMAAEAAYRDGQPWLDEMLAYLQANRNALADFVEHCLPGVSMAKPEGTYLAWLDCRGANLPERPGSFFLKHAHVGLNEGAMFGKGGEGFVRLNFGTPRSLLMQGLERMQRALENR